MQEKPSIYHGMEPQGIIESYLQKINRKKALLTVASGVLLGVLLWNWWKQDAELKLSLVVLGLILVTHLIYRRAISSDFLGLLTILDTDCDPGKYRAVIEGLRSKDPFGRSQMQCDLECAIADFYDARPAEALERLSMVSFAPNSSWRARTYNIEALCHHALGNEEERDQAVQRLTDMRTLFRKGMPIRQDLEELLLDMNVWFQPPEAWDKEEIARIHQRLEQAQSRQNRISWQIYLAEHEFCRGQRETVRQLLAEIEAGPVTPSAQKSVDKLKAKLEEAD